MDDTELRKVIEKTCDRAWVVAHSGAAPDSRKVKRILDALLELAKLKPLDDIMLSMLSVSLDALHDRLELPGFDQEEESPELPFDEGYAALEPWLTARDRDSGMVLYSLPEVHRIDEALLPRLVEPDAPDLRGSWTRITIPSRVSLPLRPPSYDGAVGYEWRRPVIRFSERVLHIEQTSRYRDYDGSRSTQQDFCAAYRIQGHLVHVRGASLYW